MTRLLTLRILFATVVNAAAVANPVKPVIIGILPSTSVVLVFLSVF